MKKEFTLASVLLALIIFIALGLTASQTLNHVAAPACAVTMSNVIASAQGDVYDMQGATDYQAPDSAYLVNYEVHGNTLSNPVYESVPDNLKPEQKDAIDQRQAWELFTTLIPLQNREMVTQYHVFTDGVDETLAAADQNQGDLTHWALEIDVADLQNKDALMFTLIHEYAHILTLNAAQSETDQDVMDDPTNQDMLLQKAAACPNFFTGWGCSYPDSYINTFYKRFWVNINDEWQQADALQYNTDDYVPYYNALYTFYKKHQDQFVDDYATTHPDEDIAESFAYFVFSPKPTGNSIKEQKIKFFYEYPELVRLREEILSGACTMK